MDGELRLLHCGRLAADVDTMEPAPDPRQDGTRRDAVEDGGLGRAG